VNTRGGKRREKKPGGIHLFLKIRVGGGGGGFEQSQGSTLPKMIHVFMHGGRESELRELYDEINMVFREEEGRTRLRRKNYQREGWKRRVVVASERGKLITIAHRNVLGEDAGKRLREGEARECTSARGEEWGSNYVTVTKSRRLT